MVIVVAEGAGMDLVKAGDLGKDKSGNAKLPPIGQYLSDRINSWAEVEEKIEVTLKVCANKIFTSVASIAAACPIF